MREIEREVVVGDLKKNREREREVRLIYLSKSLIMIVCSWANERPSNTDLHLFFFYFFLS